MGPFFHHCLSLTDIFRDLKSHWVSTETDTRWHILPLFCVDKMRQNQPGKHTPTAKKLFLKCTCNCSETAPTQVLTEEHTQNRHKPQPGGKAMIKDMSGLPIVRGIMPWRGIRLSSRPSRPPYKEWEMRRSWSSRDVFTVWDPSGLPGASWMKREDHIRIILVFTQSVFFYSELKKNFLDMCHNFRIFKFVQLKESKTFLRLSYCLERTVEQFPLTYFSLKCPSLIPFLAVYSVANS